MRIILMLLLLVVCFLTGILYGVRFEQVEIDKHPIEESVITENDVIIEPVDEQSDIIPAHTGDTPAFQAASALESVVNFFYDAIVELLYHVSKVFF